MSRLVDSYLLRRLPPGDGVIADVRYSFDVVFEKPWWTFQVTKHAGQPETVKLCSNPRGRVALDNDLFERGFIVIHGDPKARLVAEWPVRQRYAVKGQTTV